MEDAATNVVKEPIIALNLSNRIAQIKNLRHGFLQGNVYLISERFHVALKDIERHILGQIIKVKKKCD